MSIKELNSTMREVLVELKMLTHQTIRTRRVIGFVNIVNIITLVVIILLLTKG